MAAFFSGSVQRKSRRRAVAERETLHTFVQERRNIVAQVRRLAGNQAPVPEHHRATAVATFC